VSLLYLDELAGRREQVVEDNLNDNINVIRIAISMLTEKDLSDLEHMREYQRNMKRLFNLERFAFVDTDGLVYTADEGVRDEMNQYAFNQEDSTVTSKYGSTGLGMPITRSIVELMNGHIGVESEKGKGTTFTVTVTLGESGRRNGEAGDGNPAEAPEADGKTGVPDLRGRRVLLAEDVEVNAEIMVMVLSMRGVEADLAENGRIAVDRYLEHPAGYYAAILMDMRMPEMDGLEATRTIWTSGHGDAETIPIIAMTANAFDEDVQRSMQAGLNAHLSKPVEPEILFSTLESLIRS
jgi:CheY-like chemotaxis protein